MHTNISWCYRTLIITYCQLLGNDPPIITTCFFVFVIGSLLCLEIARQFIISLVLRGRILNRIAALYWGIDGTLKFYQGA